MRATLRPELRSLRVFSAWCQPTLLRSSGHVGVHRRRGRPRPMTEIAEHIGSGKVRELYQLRPRDLGDDRLELIATDRISAFDVILPTDIPHKGCILTGLSAFWFSRTRHICPNHLLE